MKTKNKYVGVDVHKDTTVVAMADGGRDGDGARQRGAGVRFFRMTTYRRADARCGKSQAQ